MDLSFSKNLNHERRPIDEENSWEPTNAVPNFTWNSLNWSDDDNIFKKDLIFSSSALVYRKLPIISSICFADSEIEQDLSPRTNKA